MSHGKVEKMLVGWREWVCLPELGIEAIKAKIDTGARTSALHAFRLRSFEEDGRQMVAFSLHPLQKRDLPEVDCIAEIIDRRRVRDSGGHAEWRYIIRSKVSLAGQIWAVEFSLTNRENMGFRMLLGREAMRGRLQVDPGRSFMTGKALSKIYR